MFEIEKLPQSLFDKKNAALLTGIMRGAEREALRTNLEGKLALTPHPKSLGSALTHPQITTDFSESLLEFITPPTHRIGDLFKHLEAIQKYTLSQLKDEIIWTSSMPCGLGEDGDIPVAQYGSSNNGQMKTIYRVGLGNRYGRAMQTVSGVHYNFSLPNSFWAFLSNEENSLDTLQNYRDKGYFNLIRNFRRHYWLLIYLFGASPALCDSFISGKPHNLEYLADGHTLHAPYGTSLRMGDLGYQSTAQESLYVCYNNKNSYIKTLCRAITTPHAEYEARGVRDDQGNYQQLNASLLQIENEFYSSVRPKRTARPGETALSALQNRGVEYMEVRCLDVDPYSPLGISTEQAHFVDTFLVYCALQTSPDTSEDEFSKILSNQKRVVNRGREPGLTLSHPELGDYSLQNWGTELLTAMKPVAEMLDNAHGSEYHQQALEAQHSKLENPDLTPSARILNTLKERQISYPALALELSIQHNNELLDAPLAADIQRRMAHMAEESLVEQADLERSSSESFDQFLADYYKQYVCCNG